MLCTDESGNVGSGRVHALMVDGLIVYVEELPYILATGRNCTKYTKASVLIVRQTRFDLIVSVLRCKGVQKAATVLGVLQRCKASCLH